MKVPEGEAGTTTSEILWLIIPLLLISCVFVSSFLGARYKDKEAYRLCKEAGKGQVVKLQWQNSEVEYICPED